LISSGHDPATASPPAFLGYRHVRDFLFPVFGIFAAAALLQQLYAGEFARSSARYVEILCGLLIVLCVISMIQTWWSKRRPAAVNAENIEEVTGHVVSYVPVVALILTTAAFIFALPYLGYAVCIFAYLMIVGRLLYRGPVWVTLAIASFLLAFIHLIFVQQLALDLPSGSIWNGLFS
jgi:uncharacterized iron-regulated membrane protein